MKKQSARRRFSWTEAWVFASLGGGTESDKGVTLECVISNGDVLNRAIFTAEEIQDGLRQLYRSGLVMTARNRIFITDHGKSVYENAMTRRGGLFSIVDNTQKALNTPRIKHPELDGEIDLEFVSGDSIDAAYALHRKKFKEAVPSP